MPFLWRTARLRRGTVLFGWVQNRRDFGGLVFIDLRERLLTSG